MSPFSAPVRFVLPLLLLPLMAAFAAPPELPASTRRMVERLSRLEEGVDPLSNPFFTQKLAAHYTAELARTPDPQQAMPLRMPAAVAYLNDGQIPAALRELDALDRDIERFQVQISVEDLAKIVQLRAICFLRLGENENCLENHNADSCLLPIRGGGVHRLQRGSRAAVRVLSDLLENAPSPGAAWLYNIAYMTLGEYPDQVPETWRVPPRVFESDYDIKRFPDVAGPLGLDLNDLSGGVVLDDFDGDGWLDLMASASGFNSQLRLFRNQGDGTFAEKTREALLAGLTGGLNLIQADFDNDGWVDVLVLRGGWLGKDGRWPPSLLRNRGDWTFEDVTERAGLLSLRPRQTGVWLDFDGDGWLDLFLGNETVPGTGATDPCELYRNNGDGTFTECAAASGVAVEAWVKAVVSGDFNNDGRPDLYLSTLGGPNRLLMNLGPVDPAAGPRSRWAFKDVAAAAGVTGPDKSFPAWFFDYDNDGWQDIFVSGYSIQNAGDIMIDYLGMPTTAEYPRLYRNRGDGTFADVTKAAGVWKVLESMGSNFGDLDSDGWLDFYVGTGDPFLGTLIPNRMFRNDGGRRFQDVTTSGGFGQLQKGHGIAFADLNHDGTQDVYSVVGGAFRGDNYHNQLFANPGHGHHWLKLKLQGVRANRSAIGSRIKVVVRSASGIREIHRTVGSGGSFGASPLQQEIGLGDAQKIERVEIRWAGTETPQILEGLALDERYLVRQGAAPVKQPRLKSFAWPAPRTGGEAHSHQGH